MEFEKGESSSFNKRKVLIIMMAFTTVGLIGISIGLAYGLTVNSKIIGI
jgi:hypothetical protein